MFLLMIFIFLWFFYEPLLISIIENKKNTKSKHKNHKLVVYG